ncbi:MAG: SMC-Scp complex subunit ScpB [Candidatus Micrarchaeota archaeon]|nr:SMC-Scp complex subunit ScpB [Candidatus Micrarchaeota archaeon]
MGDEEIDDEGEENEKEEKDSEDELEEEEVPSVNKGEETFATKTSDSEPTETKSTRPAQPLKAMKELSEKRLIEAALFISARGLTLEELRTLTGIGALGYLQNMLNELRKEYEEKGSSIEVAEISGKYEMRVRNDYNERVKQFAQDIQISKSALRTLAYVAKHDGVLKSTVVKRVGTQVYQDVKELVDNEFLKTQKAGRSSKLILTEKFKKYFEQK